MSTAGQLGGVRPAYLEPAKENGMIETLDDIVEQIADKKGIYGACPHHDDGDCDSKGLNCRCCWTADLKDRILAAVEVDRKLKA